MTRDEESTQDTEAICDDCNGPNVTWFAPNDLWNRAAREPDGTDPMLCPRCFSVYSLFPNRQRYASSRVGCTVCAPGYGSFSARHRTLILPSARI